MESISAVSGKDPPNPLQSLASGLAPLAGWGRPGRPRGPRGPLGPVPGTLQAPGTQGAPGALDLDPIQRSPRIALARSGGPGQNDRAPSNRSAYPALLRPAAPGRRGRPSPGLRGAVRRGAATRRVAGRDGTMVSGIPGVGTMVPMVPTPGYTTPHGTIPARSPPDGYRFRGVDSPDPSQSSQGLKALFLHWGRLRLPQTPSQSSGPQAGLPPLGVLAGLTFLEGTRRQFSGLAPKGAAQRASSSTLFVSCPLSLRPPIAAQSLRSTDPGTAARRRQQNAWHREPTVEEEANGLRRLGGGLGEAKPPPVERGGLQEPSERLPVPELPGQWRKERGTLCARFLTIAKGAPGTLCARGRPYPL